MGRVVPRCLGVPRHQLILYHPFAALPSHLDHLLDILYHAEIGTGPRFGVDGKFHRGKVVSHSFLQFAVGGILSVVGQFDAEVIGMEGSPVGEGLAKQVVGGYDGSVGLDAIILRHVAEPGDEEAHQCLGKAHVSLGERPEEMNVGKYIGATCNSIAPQHLLTGGSGSDERLVFLHTGRGESIDSLIAKGTDDCHHIATVGQLRG